MEISRVLKDVLRKKLEIKSAMNILETQLLELKQELLKILPGAILDQRENQDSEIELESNEVKSTLYLMKQLSALFSESDSHPGQYALPYSDENIAELKDQLDEIQDAVQQIMLTSDQTKIKYNLTLDNLARLLTGLEKKGDIQRVPPRVVAACFLIDGREVNPRSYSQSVYSLKLRPPKVEEQPVENTSKGLLLDKTIQR